MIGLPLILWTPSVHNQRREVSHGPARRSFTPEFKQEAVDWCRRSGKSECQVARELGIPQPTFNRWMRQVATRPWEQRVSWPPRNSRCCAGKWSGSGWSATS